LQQSGALVNKEVARLMADLQYTHQAITDIEGEIESVDHTGGIGSDAAVLLLRLRTAHRERNQALARFSATAQRKAA
jgi:hypothetical protein